MSYLDVKDGNGILTKLMTTTSGSGPSLTHMPHHIVQGISGSVVVTSSAQLPVYVSSSGGSFTVTSSFTNPVAVSGNVSLNGISSVTSSVTNPIGIIGVSNINSATYSGNTLAIKLVGTGSGASNVAAVDSSNRLQVAGPVTITSMPNVTASLQNPVGITGSVTANININSNQTLANLTNITNPVTVTSSQQNPIYTLESPAVSVNTIMSSSFSYAIASGTFKLCAPDTTRKELFIHNPGPANLYVVMSSTDKNSGNNFGFTWGVGGNTVTGTIPNNHSLIVYPSGTFISTEASRTLYYGGFFVSQSVNPTSSLISITTIN